MSDVEKFVEHHNFVTKCNITCQKLAAINQNNLLISARTYKTDYIVLIVKIHKMER
jgi:hypothetical protein